MASRLGSRTANIGDNPAIRPPEVHWRALTTKPANQDDLAGLKLFAAVHPMSAGDEDVVPIWFPTANYRGPGDLTHVLGIQDALRRGELPQLALLCRYLAEELGIPRNFTLLPYEEREPNLNDVANLRKIAAGGRARRNDYPDAGKDHRSTSPQTESAVGLVYRAGLAHRDPSPANRSHGKVHNVAWSNLFEDLEGQARRQTSAATVDFFRMRCRDAINIKPDGTDQDDHPCPGPYFPTGIGSRVKSGIGGGTHSTSEPLGPSQTLRPYRQARRDTPLISYY